MTRRGMHAGTSPRWRSLVLTGSAVLLMAAVALAAPWSARNPGPVRAGGAGTAASASPSASPSVRPRSGEAQSSHGPAGQLGGRDVTPAGPARLLWGIGDQVTAAVTAPLYRDHVANLVSMWVNNRGDITGWARGVNLSAIWARGQAVELIVWLADEPDYAVSEQLQADLTGLVVSLGSKAGVKGPLYIAMFTEYETYGDGSAAYQAQLRTAFKRIAPKLRAAYAKARVGFVFGGYHWDDSLAAVNAGVKNSEDVIAASDYIACQQMQDSKSVNSSGQNILVNKTRAAVKQLGAYGKPVMVAHYKNWGDPSDQMAAFGKIASVLFSEAVLNEMVHRDHLFAFNFMGDHYINDPGPVYSAVKARIAPHAAMVSPASRAPTAGLP